MDPVGSTEHTLETSGLEYINQHLYRPYQFFNLLALELFFFILVHSVYKM